MIVGSCALEVHAGGPFEGVGLRVHVRGVIGVPEMSPSLCVSVRVHAHRGVCPPDAGTPLLHPVCFLAPCPSPGALSVQAALLSAQAADN